MSEKSPTHLDLKFLKYRAVTDYYYSIGSSDVGMLGPKICTDWPGKSVPNILVRSPDIPTQTEDVCVCNRSDKNIYLIKMIQFCLFHPFSWSESILPKPKQPFSLKIFTFFHRNPSNTTLFDLQLLFSLHFNDRGIKWEIIHERGRDSMEDSQSEPFVGLIFYIHSVSLFDYEEINQKILGFRIG